LKIIVHLILFVVSVALLADDNGETNQAWFPKTPLKAFQQQNDADAVIAFTDWDEMYLEKPTHSKPGVRIPVVKELLGDKLDEFKAKRNLVVVILDKRVGLNSPTEQTIDEVQKFLVALAFKRIVFQQAVGFPDPVTGLPILRDYTVREK